MRKALLTGLAALLLGPAVGLLGLAALLNPAAQASCLPIAGNDADAPAPPTLIAEAGRVVFPLPAGTWVRTSGFGTRVHPITGETKLHTGVDLAAPAGTPILAVADGRVEFAGPAIGFGHLILIEHNIDGRLVASGYAHMVAAGIHVQVGDDVEAGQHIADVDTDGYSTGPHLHFEIRPGGAQSAPADPEPWLAARGAANVTAPPTSDGECGVTDVPGGPPDPYVGDGPDRLVDDPTSDGRITARTAHILAQVQQRFPSTSWACWSPRPGTTSEHPLGRACDGTFGNAIGHAATGPALELGWTVTNWLKENAQTLDVEYLIWQGRIWSVARSAEGWRPYDGGGMHDPGSVTGGHFDHSHFSARSGS